MDRALSVSGERVTEKIIEKSRFITYSCHVEDEEQARAFLQRVRGLHPLATHVCHAYIADKSGALMRFSDDGEPQGTAGMPILEAIKGKGLYETAVAVVRYFGGIKLGAGGLVRAYSSCASENLSGAKVMLWQLSLKIKISVSYGEVTSLNRFLAGAECVRFGEEYGAEVAFFIAVKGDGADEFLARLTDALAGRLHIERMGALYCTYAP